MSLNPYLHTLSFHGFHPFTMTLETACWAITCFNVADIARDKPTKSNNNGANTAKNAVDGLKDTYYSASEEEGDPYGAILIFLQGTFRILDIDTSPWNANCYDYPDCVSKC